MASRLALLFSTILAIGFGVLRLLSTSSFAWIRNAVAPYVPLEYPMLFGAIFLTIYGWTDMRRLALFLAVVITLGFWIIASGAGI